MLSFSVTIFQSAIEIGLYSLYRKKMIPAFKLNKKIVRSLYLFPRKKNDDLSLASQALEKVTIFFLHVVYDAKIVRTRDAQCNSEESP